MCDSNYEYYLAEFEHIYSKYPNKFVVIKNNEILGSYDTFEDAYNETSKKEKVGTFLIQHCTKDQSNVNFFYSNNVTFV